METKQSEAALQQSCRIWFWNTFPKLRGLLFMVNNNSANKRIGHLNNELGLIAGVSDLLFIYDGTVHCIELKTMAGYQSPKQIDWQALVEDQGVSYYVVRSKEQFITLINKIVNE